MIKAERLIHKQRTYYQKKLRNQVNDLMFLSLEQKKAQHKQMVEDIHTTLIILWRFDSKLAMLRNELAANEH